MDIGLNFDKIVTPEKAVDFCLEKFQYYSYPPPIKTGDRSKDVWSILVPIIQSISGWCDFKYGMSPFLKELIIPRTPLIFQPAILSCSGVSPVPYFQRSIVDGVYLDCSYFEEKSFVFDRVWFLVGRVISIYFI